MTLSSLLGEAYSTETVFSDAFSNSIDELSKLIKNEKYKRFVCADARGFIFGSALAYKNNKGVIMSRKSGKLPM